MLCFLQTYAGQDQVDEIINQTTIPINGFEFLPANFNETLYELIGFGGLNSSIVPNVVSVYFISSLETYNILFIFFEPRSSANHLSYRAAFNTCISSFGFFFSSLDK